MAPENPLPNYGLEEIESLEHLIEAPRPVAPPARPDHVVSPGPWFWGSVGWCASLIGVMAVSLLVTVLISLLIRRSGNPDFDDRLQVELRLFSSQSETGPILAQAMGEGFLAAELCLVIYTFLIVYFRVGKDWARKLAFRWPRWDHLVLALVALPALMILHGAAHQMANRLFGLDPNASDAGKMIEPIFASWPRWLGILIIGVGPGLGEELWCRGFLGRGLVGRYGWWLGIFLTSVFFGLLHGSIPYAIGTGVMGACLHFVYVTTRSLIVPILLHGLNNSATLLIATHDIPITDVEPDAFAELMLVGAAAVLVFVVGLTLFGSRGRIVDAQGNVVEPPFPTVGLPAPSRGYVLCHEPIRICSVVLVMAAASLFGWAAYTVF